ncbi:MAG: DUF3667 domain-containing protein [Gammaproteobacteria bacterium]|nr:DUF3667 domain-containing protein [Gammaproteobacteria bacterium]MDH5262614.1 DUF3667 domain-containing protein [Gammaproteobacteria bacterium]MDH5583417.1 DUF3667 domain-containing protein [Gammaproteobacteria bacterium]
MTNHAGPLYEINFVIAGETPPDFEPWLVELGRTALDRTGIDNVRMFEHGVDSGGNSIRTCQFLVRDDAALDELLDGYFAEIDAGLAVRFGEQVRLESRTLREDHVQDLPPNESPACLNCGTRLRGQYCGSCGQRSRSRLISIWQLLREAFGDLFELDSRLWRTVLPLLTRPGKLTRDYLEGRRARYMPPFRTYLVLSVVFFLVAFFDPQSFRQIIDPDPQPTAEEIAQKKESAEAAAANEALIREKTKEKLEALEAEGKVSPDVVEDFAAGNSGFSINFGESDKDDDSQFFGNCDDASVTGDEDVPEWIEKRFTDERVKQICERNNARGSENFVDAIADNIPVALIVLLPLMALVLKLLYPLSRRYFVEHLLFFVHFHAFFFLMLVLQILLAGIAGLLGPEDGAINSISTLIIVIASFYIPVYLYKAMRHVYGQGHLVTLFKYVILLVAYLTGATFTMLGALLTVVLSA